MLLTVNDITSRKRSEQRILELNRELETRIDQVSRSTANSSRSTPFRTTCARRCHISGFAGKLEQHIGDDADPTTRHYLEVIASSARRMSSLIEDLLLYSHLGLNALRLQPVDMNALVAERRAVVGSDVGDRRIDWRVGNLPVVYGDEGMLRQVWQNLLGNAVKYTGRRAMRASRSASS